MNSFLYVGITLGLFALCIIGANTVPSITHIFDYMAAISISGMQFIVPGISYIRLRKRTGKGDNLWNNLATGSVIGGILVSCLIMYNNVAHV